MEDRQINGVYEKPRLFGSLNGPYPDYMSLGPNTIKYMSQSLETNSHTLNKQPSQTREKCDDDYLNDYRLISNRPSIRIEQPTYEEEDTDDSQYRDAHIARVYRPIETGDSEQQSLQVKILTLTHFVPCP